MSGPTETRIMLWILAQLDDKYPDGLWERQNVVAAQAGDRFIKANKKGSADIRGCYKGRYIELEVKRPGEGQTPAQKQRQIDVTRAKGIYAVVHNPTEAFAIVNAL